MQNIQSRLWKKLQKLSLNNIKYVLQSDCKKTAHPILYAVYLSTTLQNSPIRIQHLALSRKRSCKYIP